MLLSLRHRQGAAILLVLLATSLPPLLTACTPLEKNSLLTFLSAAPNATLLASWEAQLDCCQWEGISCDSRGSVTTLSLPIKGLTGPIHPSLANLTNLSHLNLSLNRLSGPLPTALLSSPRLTRLDVSFNLLTDSLNLSRPLSLQVFNVSSNHFNGTFPSLFARDLVAVNASNNSFSGTMPSDPCSNSPFLTVLDFSLNHFSGGIPRGLGNCSELIVFRAGYNNLTGLLPADLFNATALTQLSLPSNQLSGILDGGLIPRLSNLTLLDLSSNQLGGRIPDSIGKLASLEDLLLFSNNLTGLLPSTLSNCTKLSSLNLRANHLTGQLDAVDFSLLSGLNMLDLGNNNFTGEIPASLYTCISLTAMRLARNSLKGEISPDMINLRSLSYLSLSNNYLSNLTGAFQILKSCGNLTAILLHRNFIGEAMPDDPNWGDGLVNLQVISLGDCNLTGQVPPWLAKLENLEVLDLSGNQLTGPLPGWLGSLPWLFYLDMRDNHLSGEFPLGLTQLQMQVNQGNSLELPVFVEPDNASGLQYNQLAELPPAIYLRNNNLNGTIPPEIGQLKMLLVLDLSCNNFSGEIPVQLSNLTNLQTLDLSNNTLSGRIPQVLATALHFLATFSVANNHLEGPIPLEYQFWTFPDSSYEGNPGLCGPVIRRPCSSSIPGGPLPPHKHSNRKKVVLALGICFGGAFTLAILAFAMQLSTRARKMDLESDTISTLPAEVVVSPCSGEDKEYLTFSGILKATHDFDKANIIGCGGFGVVYKATLANGSKLAIKRLSGDMCVMEREFKAEVEALSMAQHRNLVSLQGYCMHGSSRLLIYSYMENDSLDYWLHERDEGAAMLDWPARLKIARGVSQGLAYIHLTCQPHIVHRDIKSSNILLDKEFVAHVADFGLARLILPYRTHVTTELVGTLGYIPPEYSQTWVATLRGDIYSFGVVMLELLTGRRPVDIFMPAPMGELVGWVQEMRSQGKHEEVFDTRLRGKGFEEEMLQVLEIACMCVHEDPFKRPTIEEVVRCLENVGAADQHFNGEGEPSSAMQGVRLGEIWRGDRESDE